MLQTVFYFSQLSIISEIFRNFLRPLSANDFQQIVITVVIRPHRSTTYV